MLEKKKKRKYRKSNGIFGSKNAGLNNTGNQSETNRRFLLQCCVSLKCRVDLISTITFRQICDALYWDWAISNGSNWDIKIVRHKKSCKMSSHFKFKAMHWKGIIIFSNQITPRFIIKLWSKLPHNSSRNSKLWHFLTAFCRRD